MIRYYMYRLCQVTGHETLINNEALSLLTFIHLKYQQLYRVIANTAK